LLPLVGREGWLLLLLLLLLRLVDRKACCWQRWRAVESLS
jgi:hypothetical protein